MYSKYYAIVGSDGYFQGHMVAPLFNINNVFELNQSRELFTSVEHYNNRNSIAGCPLAFDIDFDGNLDKAYATAKTIRDKLFRFNIDNNIYFSGSKGFHIVVPCLITGSNAHIMAKAIKKTYFDIDGVDEHIYKNKALFRVENSINKKTGLRKIKIVGNETIDDIKKLAETKRKATATIDIEYNTNIRTLINGSYQKYKELTSFTTQSTSASSFSVPLCIRKMMDDTDPPRQHWHSIIYTIAKAMLADNIDQEDVIRWFDNHNFWGCISSDGYTRRSYTKVIRSLSCSSKLSVGCKTGLGAESMQYYCSKLCPCIGGTAWEYISGKAISNTNILRDGA